jgi:excisionase family DNA binding protein
MPMNPSSTPAPLIGAMDLARRLGVSRDHVYRLLDRGQLPPAIRLGGLLKWDPRIIEAWIGQQAVHTTAAREPADRS